MKRRRPSRLGLAGGGAALLLAILIGVSLAPDLKADAPRPLPPTTLSRIARANDHAAILAAENMRARSEASAAQADALRAAEERGRAQADATIDRFNNDEAGLGTGR